MANEAGGLVAVVVAGAMQLLPWGVARLAKESRLARRIQHLGDARHALPPSPVRDELEGHLTRLGADLNRWIAPEAERLRRWQRAIVLVTSVVIVFASVQAVMHLKISDTEQGFALMVGIGFTGGCVATIISEVLGMRTTKTTARRQQSARGDAFVAAARTTGSIHAEATQHVAPTTRPTTVK